MSGYDGKFYFGTSASGTEVSYLTLNQTHTISYTVNVDTYPQPPNIAYWITLGLDSTSSGDINICGEGNFLDSTTYQYSAQDPTLDPSTNIMSITFYLPSDGVTIREQYYGTPFVLSSNTFRLRAYCLNESYAAVVMDNNAVVLGTSTIPGAPYNLVATAGDGQAVIGFDVNNGGSSLINLQYSLDDEAFVSFDPPQTISPVTISGLTNNQTYSVMLKAVNIVGISESSDPVTVTPIMCFNQGTDILCWNRVTDKEEYRPVEELKVGDIVKSYMHGYLPISHCKSSRMKNNPKKWYQCMYEMKKTEKTETMGLFKDLIVTGGHGILLDKDHVPLKMQGINNRKLRSTNTPSMVEDKYLLLCHLSPLFEKLDNRDVYTYYQFSLTDSKENADLGVNLDVDLDKRYGVWANGLLVETPSYNQIM